MPVVQAKCTNCGATLKIDNASKAAICEFCKAAYIVEDAIQHFNNSYNITNSVVHIHDNIMSDFKIVAGTLIKYKGEGTEVVIPPKVKEIGERAFSNCRYISSVIIPDTVKTIGNYAFSGCSAISTIHIPKSVAHIGGSAFSECSSLTNISIPLTVISSGESLFLNCRKLTTATVNSTSQSIKKSITTWFEGCNELASIYINFSIDEIDFSYGFKINANARLHSPSRSVVIADKVWEMREKKRKEGVELGEKMKKDIEEAKRAHNRSVLMSGAKATVLKYGSILLIALIIFFVFLQRS